MVDRIQIGGPESKGLTTDLISPYIDNSSCPTLINAYSWRGRYFKKKRGTETLGRLQRSVTGVIGNTVAGALSVNLISVLNLQGNSSIVTKTISLSDGTNTFVEPSTPNGTLIGTPSGTGTINYATGALTLSGAAAAHAVTATLQYNPDLPVMGLEDFFSTPTTYPLSIGFDTTYSYGLLQPSNVWYNVTFYKNPINPSTSNPWKTTQTPFIWSGTDYQQFWSTNYFGAMWVSNSKPGFHYAKISALADQGPTNPIAMTLTDPGGIPLTYLAVGDILWFNEIQATNVTFNGLTGIVASNTGAGVYTVRFIGNQTVATWTSGTGIAQLATNSLTGQDGIKWYDGDPNIAANGQGWVNFAPPLSEFNAATNPNPNYLIGALTITPFKDRILFGNVLVGNSRGATIVQQDTIIYSQNGTPYYIPNGPDSTGGTTNGGTRLVPNGITPPIQPPSTTSQKGSSSSFWQSPQGFGGFIAAGIPQPIVTVTNNEDVLLVGFTSKKTRLVYLSNDLLPFSFYSIDSELGDSATFSGITLDRGGLAIGQYGLALTTQYSSTRIDFKIPDQIFSIANANHGSQRINALRDFRNEWVYFTYPDVSSDWMFPTRTLLFNYRDESWAIFIENYTHHGNFRRSEGLTWQNLPYTSWEQWTTSWTDGFVQADFPDVIAGNQQGFVLIKADTTQEAPSGYIKAISVSGNVTSITSPNHCLASGDYLYIQNCIGMSNLNGTVRQIIDTANENTFTLDSRNLTPPSGTYLGNGTFTRLTNFFVQTKQFNPYWQLGRKTRIGTQKYLTDVTSGGEITSLIYTNQDSGAATNLPPYIGDDDEDDAPNTGVVFSDVISTTKAGSTQNQTQSWHRMNSSMIGDTVQLGFTMSDLQMRDQTLQIQTSEVVLHQIIIEVYPGPILANTFF